MRLKPLIVSALCFVVSLGGFLQAQERRKWEEPQNLSILNSSGDDFAPSYSYQDRAVYFSSTQNGYAEFFTSRYEARRDATSGETRPRFAPPERNNTALNQARNNQSYITFAKDGSALISTFRMTKRRPYLNIFQVAQNGTVFPKPDAIDVLNTDGFNAHPALSPSGKTVVFASNRALGRGGIDLWTASRDESGTWQVPVNMGDVLNSDGDEITPHFAAEDSLYFASNGFGGKGGFEIFLSVRLEGKWQAPVPIVELNSEYDDSDFAMLPGNVGVFASNRTGSRGGLDLYMARFVPVSQFVSAIEYKIATQTSFLTAEEFSMTDVLPFPPCLVFEPNVGTLPREMKVYFDNETSTFSPQNLRPDPLAIYTETLNILGKRLRDYPDATLTLGTTENSNSALARQRVEALRGYLQTVWNIDGKRILSKNTPQEIADTKRRLMMFAGEDAVRCVEISSSDPRITAPVRIAGVNVIAKPRKIDLALDVRPRNLLRSWNFTLVSEAVSGEKDTIFRTAGVNLPFSGTIPIEPSAWSALPEELHAHLSGTDSLGRKGRRDLVLTVYRLPLEQKRAQRVQDKIIDRYRFLVPSADAPTLSPEQQAAVREIVSLLTGATAQGATMSISPYSFGEKTNAQQVERFAKTIADEIKRQAPLFPAQALQIEAATELTTPETPQERILARSILLTIERFVPQTPQEKRGK
ncbi:MAG: hypothetical protein MUF71_06260 [Candidatus Kapabacteria bacterium]|jgi:hypothetical protein|nr:hypothetical protein [Candidatus Kapabacteria bacterium]